MRASRKTSISRPSLFPFLSVLFCLVGVLMFLAVAAAITSLKAIEGNVIWQISNASHGKNPIILNCVKDIAQSLDGRYIFRKKTEETVAYYQKWEGTPFTDFLNVLGQQERDYVLFVVRPEGISTFKILLSIIERRNRYRCTRSVSISEKPTEETLRSLPVKVRRKIEYDDDDNELKFIRVMSSEEHDLLKGLFTRRSSKKAIDRLFEETQSATDWVDYGSELFPARWELGRNEDGEVVVRYH
ncbi:MAG: hypothetical protein ACFFBD_27040 [Candidatus Hodarchaeota archaeon]